MNKIDDLECGICLESYLAIEPKILPCGHTYCLNCLNGLVKSNIITCANCNAPTVLSNGVASLPTNYLVKSIVEQVEGKEKIKPAQVLRCSEHNKTCKLFCEECKRPSCTVCAALYHRAHSCITIEDSLQHYRKTLADKIAFARSLLATINENSRSVTDSIHALEEDKLRSEQLIKKTMDLVRLSITERETQLLRDLNFAVSKETVKLSSAQSELSNMSNSAKKSIEDIERFTENLSISAISNFSTFDNMNSLILELDHISNTSSQTNITKPDLVEFQNNGLEKSISDTIQNIGKISIVRKAVPTRDYTRILPDGKQLPLKIFSSFTSNGQFLGKLELPCDLAIIPIEWQWRYLPPSKNGQSSLTNTPNNGDVFVVSEFASNRISCVEISTGNLVYTIGSITGVSSSSPGKLSQPCGLIVTRTAGPSPIKIIVADRGNNRIQIFDAETGKFLHQFTHDIWMKLPYGVAEIKHSGVLVVSNLRTYSITFHQGFPNNNNNNNNNNINNNNNNINNNDLSSVGSLLRIINTNYSPHRVISNSKGHIIVSNSVNLEVFDTMENGCKLLRAIGTKGTSSGQFQEVYGICVDPNDNILVCDHIGCRVQIFKEDGTFIHCFGKGGKGFGCFQNPVGITLKDQKIFVVDHGNNRVQLF